MRQLYHAKQPSITQLPLFVLTKVCATCKQEKSIHDFSPTPEGKYGYTAHCKPCLAAKARAQRAAKREPKPIARPGFKFCIKCGEEKPLDAFYAGRNACKACRIRYSNDNTNRRKGTPEYQAWLRRYYDSPSFKQHNRANVSRWQKSPEGRKRHNEYSRQVNATPKRKEFDRQRRTTKAYQDYHREYSSKYYKEFPEKANELRMRRVARQKGAKVGRADYRVARERSNGICYICEKQILSHHKTQYDHVIPLVRGGAHETDNIAYTHAVCNQRKNDRLITELDAFDRRGPDDLL